MAFIRKMELSDAKQTSKMTKEIMLDCWEKYEKDYYPKKALDFDISVHSPKYYRDSLKVETNFAFVAEENGENVGIAMGRLVGESGLARLGWIGVHPTRQNKGIGRALLEKATEHCRAEGCHKITLYTSPVLIPAINLYLKYSFVPEAYLQRMVECRLHQNEQMAIALPNPSREYSPKLLRYLSSSLSTVNKRLLLHARQLYP